MGNCGHGYFLCKRKKICIPLSTRCDGFRNCGNGDNSDEAGCDFDPTGGWNPIGKLCQAGIWRRNNGVSTSMRRMHRRRYDVVFTLCVLWVCDVIWMGKNGNTRELKKSISITNRCFSPQFAIENTISVENTKFQ